MKTKVSTVGDYEAIFIIVQIDQNNDEFGMSVAKSADVDHIKNFIELQHGFPTKQQILKWNETEMTCE